MSVSTIGEILYNSALNLLNCNIEIENTIFYKNIGQNGGAMNI